MERGRGRKARSGVRSTVTCGSLHLRRTISRLRILHRQLRGRLTIGAGTRSCQVWCRVMFWRGGVLGVRPSWGIVDNALFNMDGRFIFFWGGRVKEGRWGGFFRIFLKSSTANLKSSPPPMPITALWTEITSRASALPKRPDNNDDSIPIRNFRAVQTTICQQHLNVTKAWVYSPIEKYKKTDVEPISILHQAFLDSYAATY